MGALAKMAAKPLRTGVDPLVPSSGTPGAVTPGTDSWQKAYPLLFGTRKVPLPPIRPGSLPTSGAPSGIDSIDSILGPSVQAAKGALSELDAMSVSPNVDTASVDAAKAEVRELISLLASVPGGVATARGAVEGLRSSIAGLTASVGTASARVGAARSGVVATAVQNSRSDRA